MDIVSHGLWGGIAFGRKNRKNFILAFLIGLLPDVLSFGIILAGSILGFFQRTDWSGGPPDPALIPSFANHLYNITHSIIIFAAVFLIVWIIRKRPWWILGAWGLHILIDIPSHSYQFFPTPFLWPIADFKFNGISWGSPEIFIPNIILLFILYIWFYIAKRKQKA